MAKTILTLSLLVPWFMVLPQTHAQNVFIETIALIGDSVPDSDLTIKAVNLPAIDATGRIAFRAPDIFEARFFQSTLTGGDLIRLPDTAPGFPADINDPVSIVFPASELSSTIIVNAAGMLAFTAAVFNDSRSVSVNSVLYQGTSVANLSILARSDMLDLPALSQSDPPGSAFVSMEGLAMNASGAATFVTKAGVGLSNVGLNGVFIASGGAPVRIALAGEQAPDTATGAVFAGFDPKSLVINAQGDVAFIGFLEQGPGGVTSDSQVGIWFYRTGSLRLVARTNDGAPGTFNNVSFEGFSELAISPTGEVAFLGRLVTSTQPAGIWRGTGTADLRAVSVNGRASDRLPQPTGLGISVILGSFSAPVFTKAGDLLFTAVGGRVPSAIWMDDNGVLQTVIRGPVMEEDGITVLIPGDEAGVDSGETFLTLGEFVANGEGSLAFTADNTGSGVTGVWAQDSLGVPQFVGQLGDIINTGNNTEIIRSISFLSGRGNVSGYGSGFGDGFDLAIKIEFQGGGAGIFRAMIDSVTRPPSASTDIFWGGACKNIFWHSTLCAATNWVDANGEPLAAPPGAAGNEVVTIEKSVAVDGVVLRDISTEIGSLTTDGTLTVREQLTLNEDSRIDSLVLDVPTGHVVVNSKLTLTGNGTALSSGTITMNGDLGIINDGMAVAALPADKFPTDQTPPDIIFAGTAPWNNVDGATFTQSLDILINDHTDVPAIVNKHGATWIMKSAMLVTDSSASFVNGGRFVANGANSASNSVLDLFYQSELFSKTIVQEGTLTLRGGGSFSGQGFPIDLSSSTSTLRLGGKEGKARVTYRLLEGMHVFNTFGARTGGSIAVDDNATLEVAPGAIVENLLVDTADGDAFQLNGTGEITLGADFLNTGDFIWFGGKISTLGLFNFTSGVLDAVSPPALINTGRFSISGTQLNTLAGLLVNNKSTSITTGQMTLSSRLTLDGGELRNFGLLLLEEDSALVDGATAGVITNQGSLNALPTDTGAGGTATIATKLNNKGRVFVGAVSENRKITLVVTGPIDQLSGTALTAGGWFIGKGSVLDLDGRTITQLGTETGKLAEVVLTGTAQLPGLLLDRIERSGSLILQEGHSFILPGSLINAGELVVGGFLGNIGTSALRINGDFHQRGDLTISGTRGAIPQRSQMQVTSGDVILHDKSITTINGVLNVLTMGKTITVDGVLNGHGLINGLELSVVVAAGRMKVGNTPGTLTIDADFILSAEGRLEIEVGGTDVGNNQDQLIINGDANIDGTLVLKFIDDFSPQAGQTFNFLSVSGTQTGNFKNVEIVDLAAGFEFAVSPTSAGFMLEATNNGVFTGIAGEINDLEIGRNTPVAETVANPGDTNVPMLLFEITPEADGLTISNLTIQADGSGDDVADLSGVTVWLDVAGNGRVDPDDTAIGSGVFATDNATLVLSLDPPYVVGARTTAPLLITYDIAPVAVSNARLIGDTIESLSIRTTSFSERISFATTCAWAAAFALIICLGLTAPRRYRMGATFGSIILAMVLITGCPGGGGSTLKPVTFGVTLRAISAAEFGTNADASVNDLALSGTNLTVVR